MWKCFFDLIQGISIFFYFRFLGKFSIDGSKNLSALVFSNMAFDVTCSHINIEHSMLRYMLCWSDYHDFSATRYVAFTVVYTVYPNHRANSRFSFSTFLHFNIFQYFSIFVVYVFLIFSSLYFPICGHTRSAVRTLCVCTIVQTLYHCFLFIYFLSYH